MCQVVPAPATSRLTGPDTSFGMSCLLALQFAVLLGSAYNAWLCCPEPLRMTWLYTDT